jgi:hypothetical protein
MKKIYYLTLLVLLASGGLFAQMPFPMGEPVKLGMGELGIGGMFLTGLQFSKTDQEDNASDGVWTAGIINPTWAENRTDIYLSYNLLNYGAFVTLRSQGWGKNVFDSNDYGAMAPYLGTFNFPYALVYANFLDEKVKVSVGKLHAWLQHFPDSQIWQTWFDGETFSFTEENPAVRVEFKPIKGLNFGFQYSFIDATADWVATEQYKEFGIGATYTQEKFKIAAGVRLDSKADGMGRADFRTYLADYYGDANSWNQKLQDNFRTPPGDDYDKGIHAFAGTRLNLIENLRMDFQAGFFGLGDFNSYGYGRMNESINYSIAAVPGLGIGVSAGQQFYGSDVFIETLVNSPLLNFGAGVTYQLPFLKNVLGSLEGSMGFCDGVLDSQWEIKPKIEIQINTIVPVFTIELYYLVGHTDYKDSTSIKPATNHSINLAAMMMF